MRLRTELNLVVSILALIAFTSVYGQKTGSKNEASWLSDVIFTGNKSFSDKELLDLFLFEDDIAGSVNSLFVYPFAERQDVHLKNRLRDFYRRRGHLEVEIGEPKVETVGDGHRVTVRIEEGPRYRLGNVTFSGADKAIISELQGVLGLKKGQVADLEALHKAVYIEIAKFFGARGHAFAFAEMENVKVHHPKEDEGDGTVDFEIVIYAGRTYRIKEVNVVGDADPSLVRSLLTFANGEVFRQSSGL